ncbi:MAG: hypothetical protein ND807_16480 [Vicinamibacterales bacterium]|nr:hypothetical protein [Vicinamibacterales bacterium]
MRLMSMCVGLAMLMLPLSAAAQTGDLPKVKGFPTLYVTDATGRETEGKLVSWMGSTLVLQTGTTTRTFAAGEVVRVDLKGDSLKNGALIGAGVGVAMAVLAGLSVGDCDDCAGTSVAIALTVIPIYTAIGVGFDALFHGRTPLWLASSAGNSGSGLTFNISPQRRSAFIGWRVR